MQERRAGTSPLRSFAVWRLEGIAPKMVESSAMPGAERLAMTQMRSGVNQLVPFPVIKAAVTGDAETVSKILNHFDR